MDNKTSTTRARIDLGARRSYILQKPSSILRKPQPSHQTLSYRSHSTRNGFKIQPESISVLDQRNNLIRNRSREQKADSSLSLSRFPPFSSFPFLALTSHSLIKHPLIILQSKKQEAFEEQLKFSSSSLSSPFSPTPTNPVRPYK